MRSFKVLQVREALAYARAGGQALHLHRIIVNYDTAPRCFVNAIKRGEDIAHLFDLDTARLKKTARKLGVNVIFVDKAGTPNQHIDLCGKPLQKAKAMCKDDAPTKLRYGGRFDA